MKKGDKLTLEKSKEKKSAPVKINQQSYCRFNLYRSLLVLLLTL